MAGYTYRGPVPVRLLLDNPEALAVQRSLNDVLLRITYRDGRPSVTQYAPPGKAAYLLRRYSKERYDASDDLFAYVEQVTEKAA